MIAELQNKSSEFVEGWKQQSRDKKHAVFQNKHNLLQELAKTSIILKNTTTDNLKHQAISNLKQLLNAEIRQKGKNEIVEAWKLQILNKNAEILANRRQVLNEIEGQKSKIRNKLQKIPVEEKFESETEKKSALLAEIRKIILPKWKEIQNNQKRAAMENRNILNLEFSNGWKGKNLKASDDMVKLRQAVLKSIRNLEKNQPVVENWREEQRNLIAEPMVLKQQMLGDLVQKRNMRLKSISDDRSKLLASIKARNTEATVVEAWKDKIFTQKLKVLRARQAVLCEIAENHVKLAAKPDKNQENLMSEIRQKVAENHPNAGFTPVVESWRQNQRNLKSKLLQNKKRVLVDISSLKSTKQARKSLKRVEIDSHKNLMQEIRTEKFPEWKEKINAARVQAIQAKKQACLEIASNLPKLNNQKTVAENKNLVNAEILAKFGNFREAWRNQNLAQTASTMGQKRLLNLEISENLPKLSNFLSQPELKNKMHQELRTVSDTTLPNWQENLLAENAKILGHRALMMADVRICGAAVKIDLVPILSFREVKHQVLKEIRRPCPVEAWKEMENLKIADKFENRRAVMSEIVEVVDKNLDCSRSVVELRSLCLDEIKKLNADFVIPEWKMKKLNYRRSVFDNKTMLNRSIENLDL